MDQEDSKLLQTLLGQALEKLEQVDALAKRMGLEDILGGISAQAQSAIHDLVATGQGISGYIGLLQHYGLDPSECTMGYFSILPDELVERILLQLPGKELVMIQLWNSSFRDMHYESIKERHPLPALKKEIHPRRREQIFLSAPIPDHALGSFLLVVLEGLGLPRAYYHYFDQEDCVEVDKLMLLREHDVSRLGIRRVGHMRKILVRLWQIRVKAREGKKGRKKGKKVNLPDEAWIEIARSMGDLTAQHNVYTVDRPELPALPDIPALIVAEYARKELRTVPEEVWQRKDATVLNLFKNKLESIDGEKLGHMVNLTTLAVNENALSTIPNEIGYLTNLRTLDVRSNRLKELPASISYLTRLCNIFMRYNRLTQLPEGLKGLRYLEILSFRDNMIHEMPSLAELHSLRLIDGSNNKLTQLGSIRHMQDLKELDLKHNVISALVDKSWIHLTSLARVDLAHNRLTSFPICIADLAHLQHLDMESNAIAVIPASIGSLVELESLCLARNHITSCPPEVGMCAKLKTLSLKGNRLSTLPDSFAALTNLKELDISTNDIVDLPGSVFLPSLVQLNVSDNCLVSLSSSVSQLVSLRILDGEANQLTSLPGEIRALTSLRELRLGCNELTSIPHLYGLNKVTMLSLEHNQLTELSPSVGALESLSRLVLSENLLNDLPNELVELDKLSELRVDCNPMENIPDAKKGGNAAFHYIIRRAAAQSKKKKGKK